MSGTTEYKGYTIDIEQCADPVNPRTDYDHLGVMICFHNRYRLGDQGHDYKASDFSSWAELEERLWEDEAVVVLPMYMIEHSGLYLHCGEDIPPSWAGDYKWDGGQIGFNVAFRDAILKEYSIKPITKRILAEVNRILKAECAEYAQYLNDDVWGYIITDAEGKEVDSLWGLYGYDYAESEAEAFVDSLVGGSADE